MLFNYALLFVFSFKKCPPKCLRRNMTVRPWSDFEKDTPAKVVMASSLLVIYLAYILLSAVPGLHTSYDKSKCVINTFVNQSIYGFDNSLESTSVNNIKVRYFYGYEKIRD